MISLHIDAMPPATVAVTSPARAQVAALRNPITARSLTVDGQTVQELVIDLRAPGVQAKPAIANHRLGTTASLAEIAAQNHAIAAINGTFFDAGGDNFPAGALELDGSFVFNARGTLLGFGPNGTTTMLRAAEALSLDVDDPSSSTSAMWPWFLNRLSANPMRVDVLTPYFGPATRDPSALVAQVVGGKVTALHRGITPIPSDGYDIELGASEAQTPIASRVHVGDPATLTDTVLALPSDKPVPFAAYPNAIGAGPMLVQNGRIDVEPSLEGLDDPEILDAETLRSVVGTDRAGHLVFLTIHQANVWQEASIAKALGLWDAMNLDGGSSVGLWYEGHYLTPPKRALATAIVVVER
ncbi:phosphodiester glycosidase family protein [Alicyclobacillus sendaiensis]|uniref:Phosphodiester glycosidase family protein n=1 Tax=Alicyclobacillus sendaiensis PA2 TaxID=3029425 RepID=A0ABT6XU92_ALISE|nr:phosphodiester glycosidase family protein [Alicyclobacillus sendaiensis]MDI9258654.1 phosphodiester glycosidase family protein [Alicyclobacillus sendaiensis PA2]